MRAWPASLIAVVLLGCSADPRIPDSALWATRHEPMVFPSLGAIGADLLVVSRHQDMARAEAFDADTGERTWSRLIGAMYDSAPIGTSSSGEALIGLPASDGGWDLASMSPGGDIQATQHWARPGTLTMENGVMALSGDDTLAVRPFGADQDTWTVSTPHDGRPIVSTDGDVSVVYSVNDGGGWCARTRTRCSCHSGCPDHCGLGEACVYDNPSELWLARFGSDGAPAWDMKVTTFAEHQGRPLAAYLPDGDLVLAAIALPTPGVAELEVTRWGRGQESRWMRTIPLHERGFSTATSLVVTPEGDIAIGGGLEALRIDPQPTTSYLAPDQGYVLTIAASDGSLVQQAELYEGVVALASGAHVYAALPVDLLALDAP